MTISRDPLADAAKKCTSRYQGPSGDTYECERDRHHPRLHAYTFWVADGSTTIRWNDRQAIPGSTPEAKTTVEVTQDTLKHLARFVARHDIAPGTALDKALGEARKALRGEEI